MAKHGTWYMSKTPEEKASYNKAVEEIGKQQRMRDLKERIIDIIERYRQAEDAAEDIMELLKEE